MFNNNYLSLDIYRGGYKILSDKNITDSTVYSISLINIITNKLVV